MGKLDTVQHLASALRATDSGQFKLLAL